MPIYADTTTGQRASGRPAEVQPDRTAMRLLVIEDDHDAADYLVKAFREARQGIDITKTEYLPTYKALHDGFHELAAHSSNERLVHINVNKLINKTVGIGPGERQCLPVPHKSLLVAAQFMAASAINGASDHRDGYARVKQALATLQVPALGSAL